jgi:hypothetical protein
MLFVSLLQLLRLLLVPLLHLLPPRFTQTLERAKSIALTIRLGPSPQAVSDTRFCSDVTRLRRISFEFLSKAIDSGAQAP